MYPLPPILLPADERYGPLFRLEQLRLARFIAGRMEEHRFRSPLLWCACPEQVHLLDRLDYDGLIYDCDREWDDLPPAWEGSLASAADVVFAASPELAERLSPCSGNIALLPNGVNHPMFTRPPAELPPELRGLSSPILGYTGTLWRDLDLAPVLYAAQAMPACTFVFLGRREKNPMAELLERLPNVRLLGRRAPVEVPDYLARFDVCLNLLRRSEQGNDVVPCRIYEYLSSGKPVVSMLFPEQVEHFPDVVYGAHSPEEFAALCRRALAETGDWAKNRRREHGAAAAWSARADEVTRILGTTGLY